MTAYRRYGENEVGKDGYPPEWHKTIKHQVREAADHRCVRCGHPYRRGEHERGEWSPCDDECRHGGPVRFWTPTEGWGEYDGPDLTVADTVEARWRILTVHHLTGEKADCRWWNVVPLCQRCHLTIQGRVRMERVWPWPHTKWFRPYVAGYYAWTYLGEDLTRPEVEALLGLELVGHTGKREAS